MSGSLQPLYESALSASLQVDFDWTSFGSLGEARHRKVEQHMLSLVRLYVATTGDPAPLEDLKRRQARSRERRRLRREGRPR